MIAANHARRKLELQLAIAKATARPLDKAIANGVRSGMVNLIGI